MIEKKLNLKPCPFCGGEAHVSYSNDNHRSPHVECDTLHCPGNKTYQWHYRTVEEAVEAWNKRRVEQDNDR